MKLHFVKAENLPVKRQSIGGMGKRIWLSDLSLARINEVNGSFRKLFCPHIVLSSDHGVAVIFYCDVFLFVATGTRDRRRPAPIST